MIRASCLCGSIRFELDGELQAPRYCYCVNCTKFAGTSPASWIMARRGDFVPRIDGAITCFDSGRGKRCFCATCGSPVWFESKDDENVVMLPLGVFDDGDIPAPGMHIWVSSKPGWCAIRDELPQHATGPNTSMSGTKS